MKKMITAIASITVLAIASASASSIFDGYAYVSDTTAGVGSTWYNLNGSAQSQSLDGTDIGDFESNLWLGGQTMIWPNNDDDVDYAKLHYSITGEATASGSIDYSRQAYVGSDERWGTDVNGDVTSDLSVDLIATHSLGVGSYNIAVWVEGKPFNTGSVWDSNGGGNYNATFGVIPEPATMGLVAVMGAATLFVRRIFMM